MALMRTAVTTAADIERMTPAEQSALFDACIVWDPDNHPDPYLRAFVAKTRQETLDDIEGL